MTDNLVDRLRKEAARNARMQGDKEHQTNRRRKTFRGRNRLFTEAADHITELKAQVRELWAMEERIVDIIERMETLPQELMYSRGVASEFRAALANKK